MADGSQHSRHRFGSLFAGTPTYDAAVRRKKVAFGFLDRVCEAIEPTETQQGQAKSSYEAVSDWLARDAQLGQALIYAQGSAALGTMIKPVGRNEFDVDLICRVPGYGHALAPERLKSMVGDRLKAHERYAGMLEEKARCWRLNYAGQFHLDITPSIPNPACANGGELVPDQLLQHYKASNPTGYRKLFAERASLMAMVRLSKAFDGRVHAEIKPYPETARVKGVLRRTVQLLKVHRDHMFQRLRLDPALAPLSIIITSLAMRAYEYCVQNYEYDNELDLMCDTIRMMPVFIERLVRDGQVFFLIPNETTQGENFAEKWNDDFARAKAFYDWHERALAAVEAFAESEGLDRLQKSLSDAMGTEPVQKVARDSMDRIDAARRSGALSVAAGAGLSPKPVSSSTLVRPNTFFGR